MDYNWESTTYASSNDVLGGYPFPKLSGKQPTFSLNNIASRFHQDLQLYGYFHTETPIPEFHLNRIIGRFDSEDKSFFGYVFPLDAPIYKTGAFAHTDNLTEIVFPITVMELGPYTCAESNISNVTISPACSFYPTTFIDDCTITFYSCSIQLATFPITPVQFTVGDDWKQMLVGTYVTLSVLETNESTPINQITKNFDIIGIDTSAEVTDAAAKLVVKRYDNSIIGEYNFTYSVVSGE